MIWVMCTADERVWWAWALGVLGRKGRASLEQRQGQRGAQGKAVTFGSDGHAQLMCSGGTSAQSASACVKPHDTHALQTVGVPLLPRPCAHLLPLASLPTPTPTTSRGL